MGLLDNVKIGETDRKPCVLVFRYRENNFASNGRIVFSQELRFMKSLSCNGECCGVEEEKRHFDPFIDADESGIENLNLRIPKNAVDGQLFQAVFRPGSPDWETVYVEESNWDLIPFDLEFRDLRSDTR